MAGSCLAVKLEEIELKAKHEQAATCRSHMHSTRAPPSNRPAGPIYSPPSAPISLYLSAEYIHIHYPPLRAARFLPLRWLKQAHTHMTGGAERHPAQAFLAINSRIIGYHLFVSGHPSIITIIPFFRQIVRWTTQPGAPGMPRVVLCKRQVERNAGIISALQRCVCTMATHDPCFKHNGHHLSIAHSPWTQFAPYSNFKAPVNLCFTTHIRRQMFP